mmetsp:Transcript_88895/g.251971  ORF Transcript_88895/g.251971 Transcript_88895/m.251971 type:complete len:205 (+) Transcript_88895:264-878(+)
MPARVTRSRGFSARCLGGQLTAGSARLKGGSGTDLSHRSCLAMLATFRILTSSSGGEPLATTSTASWSGWGVRAALCPVSDPRASASRPYCACPRGRPATGTAACSARAASPRRSRGGTSSPPSSACCRPLPSGGGASPLSSARSASTWQTGCARRSTPSRRASTRSTRARAPTTALAGARTSGSRWTTPRRTVASTGARRART